MPTQRRRAIDALYRLLFHDGAPARALLTKDELDDVWEFLEREDYCCRYEDACTEEEDAE